MMRSHGRGRYRQAQPTMIAPWPVAEKHGTRGWVGCSHTGCPVDARSTIVGEWKNAAAMGPDCPVLQF